MATLTYSPDCATIEGSVTLVRNNETLVFRGEVEERFRGDRIRVCFDYEKHEEPMLRTAACVRGNVISIIYMERVSPS